MSTTQEITYATDIECSAGKGFEITEDSRPNIIISRVWRQMAKSLIVERLGSALPDQNNILKRIEIQLWGLQYSNMDDPNYEMYLTENMKGSLDDFLSEYGTGITLGIKRVT